ncbi:hypothetical protein MHN28_17585 [Ruegeria sp. Ofav3-42]|nr:hypothetical protein [Ruegeria sp. Ofav3-42]
MLHRKFEANKPDSDEAVLSFFHSLRRIDRNLQFPEGSGQRLQDLELKPFPFNKSHLFECIARQQPVLYSDFPRPLARGSDGGHVCAPDQLAAQLARCTAPDTYRVRLGTGDEKRHLTIAEILQRWRQSGVVMGVTDLPVRNGPLAEYFDVDFLKPWNLMPNASDEIRELEMLTAVFSTAGKLTDSHSDDMAVCNHCCVGSKLWLAWETYEGLDAGLEDVERVDLNAKARFDPEAFLSLKSACWFIVQPGETIFLPGKFTHRVYTLENYIGVGSFYVGFSNLLHTARRWMTHGSLWDPVADGPKGQHADKLLEFGSAELMKVLQADQEKQRDFGTDAISVALDHINWSDPDVMGIVKARTSFARAAEALRKAGKKT